jgi:Immunoglobulin I-set domain.
VTVLEGQSVQFQCRVGGDPDPNILWRRDDGKMPIGRAQILDDRSLRIENVESADEGLYICDAENLVGSVSARASLTVHCKCSVQYRTVPVNSFGCYISVHLTKITS